MPRSPKSPKPPAPPPPPSRELLLFSRAGLQFYRWVEDGVEMGPLFMSNQKAKALLWQRMRLEKRL